LTLFVGLCFGGLLWALGAGDLGYSMVPRVHLVLAKRGRGMENRVERGWRCFLSGDLGGVYDCSGVNGTSLQGHLPLLST